MKRVIHLTLTQENVSNVLEALNEKINSLEEFKHDEGREEEIAARDKEIAEYEEAEKRIQMQYEIQA